MIRTQLPYYLLFTTSKLQCVDLWGGYIVKIDNPMDLSKFMKF